MQETLVPSLGREDPLEEEIHYPLSTIRYPLQNSSLENSMHRGACRATVCGVAESHRTELWTHTTTWAHKGPNRNTDGIHSFINFCFNTYYSSKQCWCWVLIYKNKSPSSPVVFSGISEGTGVRERYCESMKNTFRSRYALHIYWSQKGCNILTSLMSFVPRS